MRTALLCLAALAASPAGTPDFSGEWRLESNIGAAAPAGFTLQIRQTGTALEVRARWDAPKDGKYGLTLLGVVTPELRLSTSGAESLNQAGPFVLHSRSRWEGEKLITDWHSSAFQGQSFRGTWTHRVSDDRHKLILEIAAASGSETWSHAQLVFRR